MRPAGRLPVQGCRAGNEAVIVVPSSPERTSTMPKRWRVIYKDGPSIPMSYRMACDYARMFNGRIERVKKTTLRARAK